MNTTSGDRYGLPTSLLQKNIVQAGVSEILETFKEYTDKPLSSLTLLDIGSGQGEYSIELAKHFKKVVGVEPFEEGYQTALRTKSKKIRNLIFKHSKIEDFKSTEKFDVAVMLTVFEHMSKQNQSFQRIFSLMKKSGVIYFTAPNKYWLFEQHYGLPFLSWLPLSLANVYLNIFKGVSSFKDCSYSKSYVGLKHFLDKYPCTYKFVLPHNIDSAFIGCGNKNPIFPLIKKVGINLIKSAPFFWNFSKGFIVVIKKK